MMSDFLKRTESQILHDYYDDAESVHNPSAEDMANSRIEFGGVVVRSPFSVFIPLPNNFEYVSSEYELLYPAAENTTNVHTFVLRNTKSGTTYKIIVHRVRCHRCVVKSITEI